MVRTLPGHSLHCSELASRVAVRLALRSVSAAAYARRKPPMQMRDRALGTPR